MTPITMRSVLWATMTVVTTFGSTVWADEPDAVAFAQLGDSGGVIGAEVQFRCQLNRRQKDHVYELYYQCRVHTKKGEYGPILGTAENPKGKVFFVKQIIDNDRASVDLSAACSAAC